MNLKHLLVFTLLVTSSCRSDAEQRAEAEVVAPNNVASPSPVHNDTKTVGTKLQALRGSYLGNISQNVFMRSRLRGILNLTVDSVNESGKILAGHTIREGKKTSFKATYTLNQKAIISSIDIENDVYKLELSRDATKLFLSRKGYERSELKRKVFKYDPSHHVNLKKLKHYLYRSDGLNVGTNKSPKNFNASVQKLTETDLKDLIATELNVVRKSIYARHGLAFQKSADVYFFENVVEWYSPYFINVDDKLTDLEKANIVLLDKFEELSPNNSDEIIKNDGQHFY